jgi:hypothetical protein
MSAAGTGLTVGAVLLAKAVDQSPDSSLIFAFASKPAPTVTLRSAKSARGAIESIYRRTCFNVSAIKNASSSD